jgi:hypothetical protein
MALVAGGEGGHYIVDGFASITGTVTTQTTTKRSGTHAYACDSTGGNAAAYMTYTTSTQVTATTRYHRVWFRASAFPTATSSIFGCGAWVVRMSSAGAISAATIANVPITGSTTQSVSANTWFSVEVEFTFVSAGNDTIVVRVDGTQIANSTEALVASGPINAIPGWIDAPGASKVLYVDDMTITDSTGSAPTTAPHREGKIVALLPTADSARDAGWLNGASGTTSLYDAVNNTPPTGVVIGSAGATTQVRNAVSTTAEAYSATMTTYTAAGIDSDDTVNLVQAVAMAGNSSTTGSDTLGVQVTSNPAIAEVTPSIDVTTGTFPTGWNWGATTWANLPSVTKGTAPVMRIRKNIANTRTSQCCFMGMMVDYTVVTAGAATRYRSIMMVG